MVSLCLPSSVVLYIPYKIMLKVKIMKISFEKIMFLFVGFVCVGFVRYLFLESMKSDTSKLDVVHALRIAIFQPATHPALDEIAQGFIDVMNDSDHEYIFTRYNANGNKILMYAQAQEMLQQSYDLVFTIGLGCSVAMKELTAKQGDHTPVVFCAIDDPVNFNVQGSNITGVIDKSNYARQIDITLQLKPSIKKVMLVYDVSQGSGLEKDKDAVQAILQEKNIDLKAVEINGLTEIQQKVTAFMDSADLIMILKDNTIVSGIDTIIKLCQNYHVPLLASDLNSGEKGAVLAYGIHEYDSGAQGALQAKLILEQGKQPDQVFIVAVDTMVMKINRKQAALQGLDLDFDNFSIADVELN